MRRVVPWALLGFLVVGTVAGAAVGVAQKASGPVPSAAQWVAAVLAGTERAGTAHFAYTHVTASPNPDLRETMTGSGVVDFARGAVHASETDHSISFTSSLGQPLHPVASTSAVDAIVVGGVQYQRNAIAGIAFTNRYVKLSLPPPPRSGRGLALALNASVAVDPLYGPERVAAVHELGPATVAGTPTTRYRVSYAPLVTCAPDHTAPLVVTQAPSLLWVDGRGRLVQARSSYHDSGLLPKGVRLPPEFDGFPQAPTTTTATLTFSAFGVPVHITAPPAASLALDQRSSTGFAKITVGRSCHS